MFLYTYRSAKTSIKKKIKKKSKGRHITRTAPNLHFEIFFTRLIQFSPSWHVERYPPTHTECLYPKGKQIIITLPPEGTYCFKKQVLYNRKLYGTVGNKLSSWRSDKHDCTGLWFVHGSPECKATQRYLQHQALWLQWMPNEFITTGHLKWNATPP